MVQPSQSTERSPLVVVLRAVYVLAAVVSWAGYLYVTLGSGEGGSGTLPAPLALIWLILAPVLTFLPLGRILRSYSFIVIGAASWVGLGYLLAWVPPGTADDPKPVLGGVFLLVLFLALSTLFAPIAYGVGLRYFPLPLRRPDRLRAAREGAGVALYVVAGAVLRLLGVFTWLNALLLLGVLVAVEIIVLSKGRRT